MIMGGSVPLGKYGVLDWVHFFGFLHRYVLSFGMLDLKKNKVVFWIVCFFVVHRYGLMRL